MSKLTLLELIFQTVGKSPLHIIFVVSTCKDAELEEKEDLFELDMESSDAGARWTFHPIHYDYSLNHYFSSLWPFPGWLKSQKSNLKVFNKMIFFSTEELDYNLIYIVNCQIVATDSKKKDQSWFQNAIFRRTFFLAHGDYGLFNKKRI